MEKKIDYPCPFKVKDFVIFCGSRKFKVTLKIKNGIKIVFGKFIRKGGNVHLFVEIGEKRTSKPRYKSFGPKTLVLCFE